MKKPVERQLEEVKKRLIRQVETVPSQEMKDYCRIFWNEVRTIAEKYFDQTNVAVDFVSPSYGIISVSVTNHDRTSKTNRSVMITLRRDFFMKLLLEISIFDIFGKERFSIRKVIINKDVIVSEVIQKDFPFSSTADWLNDYDFNIPHSVSELPELMNAEESVESPLGEFAFTKYYAKEFEEGNFIKPLQMLFEYTDNVVAKLYNSHSFPSSCRVLTEDGLRVVFSYEYMGLLFFSRNEDTIEIEMNGICKWVISIDEDGSFNIERSVESMRGVLDRDRVEFLVYLNELIDEKFC